MFRKGNKLQSVFLGSCPKCQGESMYKDQNPYHLGRVYKMSEKCLQCGLKYKIDPSFFFGAMYVSYGLRVGLGVAIFIISNVFLGFHY